MARIAGVNIPINKRVVIALTYIYGIGNHHAHEIMNKANINMSKRVNQLTEDEIASLRSIIESDYNVEGDLRREVSMNIKSLKDLGSYRGIRHRKRLPVRGQNTQSNARTRKGKAVAIANKKK